MLYVDHFDFYMSLHNINNVNKKNTSICEEKVGQLHFTFSHKLDWLPISNMFQICSKHHNLDFIRHVLIILRYAWVYRAKTTYTKKHVSLWGKSGCKTLSISIAHTSFQSVPTLFYYKIRHGNLDFICYMLTILISIWVYIT